MNRFLLFLSLLLNTSIFCDIGNKSNEFRLHGKPLESKMLHLLPLGLLARTIFFRSPDQPDIRGFDACIETPLDAYGITLCSAIKDYIRPFVDNPYIPSEDKKLKRRLENPEELDILDGAELIGSPQEIQVVKAMMNVIDKNIELSRLHNGRLHKMIKDAGFDLTNIESATGEEVHKQYLDSLKNLYND